MHLWSIGWLWHWLPQHEHDLVGPVTQSQCSVYLDNHVKQSFLVSFVLVMSPVTNKSCLFIKWCCYHINYTWKWKWTNNFIWNFLCCLRCHLPISLCVCKLPLHMSFNKRWRVGNQWSILSQHCLLLSFLPFLLHEFILKQIITPTRQ